MARSLYYPNRYKHGKQTELISFEDVKQKVLAAKIGTQAEAYFWLLYYSGVRKSEAYERVAEDFVINDTHLIVDFGQRKKGSAKVKPLKFPLNWYGIDKILWCIEKARKRHPRNKALFVQKDKKRVRIRERARWVFPSIQSTKAWVIVKKVLGDGYYPHFLRLNRLTEIAKDPTANLTRIKSFSGIKTTKILNAYLGTDEKEQDAAIEWMDKQYK